MRLKTVSVPYGTGQTKFSIPSAMLMGILEAGPARRAFARRNATAIVKSSFDGKACAHIRRLAREKKRLLLAVPDATRKAHLKEILPFFLRLVSPLCKIDIIVASGLHEPHTARELEALVGKTVYRSCRVDCHRPGAGYVARFGTTRRGVPIDLNKRVRDYEGIVSIGVIEPHLYAGYSGGAKTVAIGLAGEATINATHCTKFLDDPMVRIGCVRSNPFQSALWEITGRVPVIFAVNVVNDPDGAIARVFSGGLEDVFRRGVAFSRRLYEANVERAADVVLCGVGHPKDANLYQASRALNYIVNTGRPILKKGGFLVVVAQLEDGLGRGIAERRCFGALRQMGSPDAFVRKIKKYGCSAGEHRAYMIAKAMCAARVIFAGENAPRVVRGLPILAFKTAGESLDYIRKKAGERASMYVVPRALSIVTRMKG